jgi:hypothetical protein
LSSRTHALGTAVLVAISLCAAGSSELEGDQTVREVIGGVEVAVQLRIRDAQQCENPEGWLWGSEQGCPRRAVSALTVQSGDQRVFVPVSAYADLAAVRSVSVASTRDGFSVNLSGGDAATSYRAALHFVGHPNKGDVVLRSREVRSGALQTETWETTKYHFRGFADGAEPPIRNP